MRCRLAGGCRRHRPAAHRVTLVTVVPVQLLSVYSSHAWLGSNKKSHPPEVEHHSLHCRLYHALSCHTTARTDETRAAEQRPNRFITSFFPHGNQNPHHDVALRRCIYVSCYSKVNMLKFHPYRPDSLKKQGLRDQLSGAVWTLLVMADPARPFWPLWSLCCADSGKCARIYRVS